MNIHVSYRAPLFVLFASAAGWVALASAFELLASVKFHSPDFLADVAWLTYGRVQAAATTALLYGFALQAGFGLALRVIAQRGPNSVSQSWLIILGGKIWNLGVLVGLIGILSGDSTGFEHLQLPSYAASLLLLGFLLIGTCAVLTLNQRNQGVIAAPHWFLLMALLWFPCIFSTATLFLLVSPVRGVSQSVIAWWYSGNLTVVWLSLVGLAASFLVLTNDFPATTKSQSTTGAGGADVSLTANPTPTGQRFHETPGMDSRSWFTFWTLVLFGSWVGIPGLTPVPAWMPTVSTIATVLMLIPLLSVAVIAYGNHGLMRMRPSQDRGFSRSHPMGGVRGRGSLPFVKFAVIAWLIAGAMKFVAALPEVNPFTQFTWFTVAQSQLNIYGFFAMSMFGAIYYLAPQVTGVDWPWTETLRAHFWCSAIGTTLLVIPLAVAGVVQGIQLNNPQVPFMDLTETTLPFLRVSTVGSALNFAGNLLLVLNVAGLSVRYVQTHFVPVYRWMTAKREREEFKS